MALLPMRRTTQRVLALSTLAVDAAVVVGAGWSFCFVPLARTIALYAVAAVLVVLYLPMALAVIAFSRHAWRVRLVEALGMMPVYVAWTAALLALPLAVVCLHAGFGCPTRVAGVVVIGALVLNVVTFLRAMIASGSADWPYRD
jgi:hypothetical protein